VRDTNISEPLITEPAPQVIDDAPTILATGGEPTQTNLLVPDVDTADAPGGTPVDLATVTGIELTAYASDGVDPGEIPGAQSYLVPLDTQIAWMVAYVVAPPQTMFPTHDTNARADSVPVRTAPERRGASDLDLVRLAALNPPGPPLGPDLDGLFVRLHSPAAISQQDLAGLSRDLRGTGAQLIEPVPFGYSVKAPHVRVYHKGDVAKARALADHLGIGLRQFTNLGTKPRRGVAEIWLAGVVPRAVQAARDEQAARARPLVLPAHERAVTQANAAAAVPAEPAPPRGLLGRLTGTGDGGRPWWVPGFLDRRDAADQGSVSAGNATGTPLK